mmetsp:Transcript_47854/g.125296  ORF Transcript_47854/g.125296 Transcript_47854/m.125296 type:complete len:255 (+) Transcript_47854:190-954(+)
MVACSFARPESSASAPADASISCSFTRMRHSVVACSHTASRSASSAAQTTSSVCGEAAWAHVINMLRYFVPFASCVVPPIVPAASSKESTAPLRITLSGPVTAVSLSSGLSSSSPPKPPLSSSSESPASVGPACASAMDSRSSRSASAMSAAFSPRIRLQQATAEVSSFASTATASSSGPRSVACNLADLLDRSTSVTTHCMTRQHVGPTRLRAAGSTADTRARAQESYISIAFSRSRSQPATCVAGGPDRRSR